MLLSTLVAALLAVAITLLLAWLVKPPAFRSLTWKALSLSAALFWGVFAVTLYLVYWESYYSYFAPPYARWLSPLAALFYIPVCLLLRGIAMRLPGSPTLNFLLLGGLESIPEHALGIHRFKILEIPGLAALTPGSIYLFAFFEYIIYWGVVLVLAASLQHLIPRLAAPVAR